MIKNFEHKDAVEVDLRAVRYQLYYDIIQGRIFDFHKSNVFFTTQ